jgi:hypothetical protein
MNLELNLEDTKVEQPFFANAQRTDANELRTLPFPNVPLNAKEQELHERSLRDAKNYLSAEAVLLQDVCEIEETKLYEKFGLTCTRAYCLKIMGLSEFIADSCIGIARKSKKIPELKEAIEIGELTVSKGIRIVPVLNEQNKTEWLNKAKTLSKNKLERAVADEKPEAIVQKLKPSSNGRSLLSISISEEFESEILRLQEIESKSNTGFASYEHVLQLAVRDRLDRVDPVRKAARAKERADKKAAGQSNANTKKASDIKKHQLRPKTRKVAVPEFVDLRELEARELDPREHGLKNYLARARYERELFTAELIHAVNDRDKRRCKALLPDGTICDSGFWTQIHHIIEVKNGGTNDLENLITLCGNHHRQWHANQNDRRKR